MENHKVFSMKLSKIYPLLVQKAERKKRTKQEVDEIIFWLTGYDEEGLAKQLQKDVDYKTFFEEAPCIHPNCEKIKGTICGVRIENIEDPLMKQIRCLDKLIDELARGKEMGKILPIELEKEQDSKGEQICQNKSDKFHPSRPQRDS